MAPRHPMSVNVNTRMRWSTMGRLPCITACRDRRVLDLAAGLGFFSTRLAARGARVLAADVHEPSLRYLESTFGIPVCRLDLESDTYPPGPFDLVLLGEVLEHVRRPEDVVAKAASSLAPAGMLIITTPALEGPLIHTPGKRLGHGHGAEKHEREGFRRDELDILVRQAGLEPRGHRYSLFFLSELFMQLTKLVFLLKRRTYGGQSDMVGSMDSLSYKALCAIYALLHPVFLAEEALCRGLGLAGNCHILWAEKP